MAEAATTTIETVVEADGVRLDLTREEAEALFDVTEFIGGHSVHTRRKHIDSIRRALTGIPWLGYDPLRLLDVDDGARIYFKGSAE